MRLPAMLVMASLFTMATPTEASSQSITLTAGLGRACHGSDGSVCRNDSATVIGTVGVRLTPRFVTSLRVSRFDDAFAGETSYYDGPDTREVARVRHETSRTMKYGAELLYYPKALAGGTMAAFAGAGIGIRASRHRASCAFGACNQPSTYGALLGTEQVRHGYVGVVAGVDATIVYGMLVRGAVRFDDFPSEVGAAQLIVELGYRFGAR